MRLTRNDIATFGKASGDFNPLHDSVVFARRTPFGAPIAHGMLACLAAIDEVGDLPDGLTGIDVVFRRPTVPDATYRVSAPTTGNGGTRLVVSDGSRTCLDISLATGARPAGQPLGEPGAEAGMRTEAAVHDPDRLVAGTAATGTYRQPPDAVRALAARWPRGHRYLGGPGFSALAWCSYLTGMEIPGRAALLCRVSLSLAPGAVAGPMRYAARVVDVDRRFGLVTVAANLSVDGAPVASAEIEAMMLRPADPPSLAAIDACVPPSSRLSGRTAVVVGGARGLGAAIALALAGQGCRVLVGHRHGGPEVPALNAQLRGRGGRIVSIVGDAGTPSWSDAVRQDLVAHGAALDLLVLNAAPTIGSVAFEPQGVERLAGYLTEAVGLVAAPLSGLLAPLVEARGRCLLVSSAALANLPADWPHYVTAKSAVEGLLRWAAANNPGVGFFVTRPGMVLTDQTNTPTSREDAAPVENVAGPVSRRLVEAVMQPGRVVSLDAG